MDLTEILYRTGLGISVSCKATAKDWFMAAISIPPSPSPFLYYIYKIYKKTTIKLNFKWSFRWFNQENINRMFLEETKCELV